jgi:hypothetical protein
MVSRNSQSPRIVAPNMLAHIGRQPLTLERQPLHRLNMRPPGSLNVVDIPVLAILKLQSDRIVLDLIVANASTRISRSIRYLHATSVRTCWRDAYPPGPIRSMPTHLLGILYTQSIRTNIVS